MKDVVRFYQDQKTGVSVKTIEHEDRYDVIVTIPAALFDESDEAYVHCGKFDLEVKRHATAKKPIKPITFSLNRGYWKVGYGLIKNKQAKIKFDTAECAGLIRLSPKFYISQSRRASQKKLKKAKEAAKAVSYAPRGNGRPSPSKYTPYIATNITTPYGGGSCSPK